MKLDQSSVDCERSNIFDSESVASCIERRRPLWATVPSCDNFSMVRCIFWRWRWWIWILYRKTPLVGSSRLALSPGHQTLQSVLLVPGPNDFVAAAFFLLVEKNQPRLVFSILGALQTLYQVQENCKGVTLRHGDVLHLLRFSFVKRWILPIPGLLEFLASSPPQTIWVKARSYVLLWELWQFSSWLVKVGEEFWWL